MECVEFSRKLNCCLIGTIMAINNAINTGVLNAGYLYLTAQGAALTTIGGTKVTTFSVSGTWIPNSKTQSVGIIGWNGGGGGGSGRQGATTAAGGGSGGSMGDWFIYNAPVGFFNPAGETVTIGAGGLGGAAQSSASTNGNNGAIGGQTFVGNVSFIGQPSTNVGGGGTTTNAATPADPGFGLNSFLGFVGLDTKGAVGTNTTGGTPGFSPAAAEASFTSFLGGACGGGGSGANSVTAQQAGNGGAIFSPFDASLDSGNSLVSGGAGGISKIGRASC